MAFLKRISDTFWSYVSPSKPSATTQAPTPQTLPRIKTKRPVGRPRKGLTEHVIKHSRSMSPVKRVDSWRLTASEASSSKKRKRVAPITPSTGAGRRRKVVKIEDDDIDYTPDIEDEDNDVFMHGANYDSDQVEDMKEESEDEDDSKDNIRLARNRSPSSHSSTRLSEFEAESEPEIDDTLVVSEDAYHDGSPFREMKVISPTTAEFSRGVSTEDLRAHGWDDDHVTLVQRLAMRGFEPLMPAYHKFALPWLPESLFADTDDAFISSVRGDQLGALRALEKLFELRSWVRDRVLMNGRVTPEEQTRRMLTEYIKWAEADAGLDHRTRIPMLEIEAQPTSVPVPKIQENARRRLALLAAQYKEAFRVKKSIEPTYSPISQTSRASKSTVLSYPVPTLYAIIASHTLIALVAYKPEDEDPEIKSVAFFDMNSKGYDVWNALALAIAVCHVRNVQMRIAEETGIGLKGADWVESETDDPDL